MLIEMLVIADINNKDGKSIASYADDGTGEATVALLKSALKITRRITGNDPASMGLHPAVYFYNERGKHSRFLFLAVVALFTERVRDNDQQFFRNFTRARQQLENVFNEYKSLLGIILQNTNKGARVSRMRDFIRYVVDSSLKGEEFSVEKAVSALGARSRIIDITSDQLSTGFSDDTKSAVFLKRSIESALKCAVCGGLLDPTKSVSYDHKNPVREGGRGEMSNCDLVHPYCNSAVKC